MNWQQKDWWLDGFSIDGIGLVWTKALKKSTWRKEFKGIKRSGMDAVRFYILILNNKPKTPWPNTWELPRWWKEAKKAYASVFKVWEWLWRGIIIWWENLVCLGWEWSQLCCVSTVRFVFGDEGQEYLFRGFYKSRKVAFPRTLKAIRKGRIIYGQMAELTGGG